MEALHCLKCVQIFSQFSTGSGKAVSWSRQENLVV